MPTVYLDRQHAGKPGRRVRDRGAAADLDGDGLVEVHEREAMLTPVYLLAAETRLIEYGFDVYTLADGSYRDRHERVNEYDRDERGASCYVAAHLNAGWRNRPGDAYGAIFYDYRSTSGRSLAKRIAAELRLVAPELSDVKVRPASPNDWTRNAFYTIANVNPVAVCYEPAFMDCETHAAILGTAEGLEAIGRALADGVNRWAAES